MLRSAIVVSLPAGESVPVREELESAGFEVFVADGPIALEAVLDARSDVALVILDGEAEEQLARAHATMQRGSGQRLPALTVVSPRAFERLAARDDGSGDEYFTRPYSADALRWRVEAMVIRRETIDDGSGPILQARTPGAPRWGDAQALSIVVFSPKGGVGKTTVAANLAAALQTRRGKSVLLVDADTVTGHVTTSLAMEGVRTVVDSWTDEAEGGPPETLAEVSSLHPSGMRVVPLTSSPLDTEILDPARVRAQVAAVRTSFDVIVVDLHPSYSALNQAIFEEADRILVPVTPDVPAIRAAVQLRDVAARLGCRERLAMVINRANSGVTVADMERTVGMPALALIRSGGLLFVRAANEGRTVIDMFPKEKISTDFEVLGDRVLGNPTIVPAARGLRFPSRARSGPAKATI